MGFGSKLKKSAKKMASAAKKTTVKKVSTASKTLNKPTKALINKLPVSAAKENLNRVVRSNALPKIKDLDNPYVRLGAQAAGAYFGGPAGATAVGTAFKVYDSRGQGSVSVLGSIAENYIPEEYKETFAEYKGTFDQYKTQYEDISNIFKAETDTAKNPAQVAENIDRSGFSNIAYSASNLAAQGAGQLTQSFFEKHKTKIIVGGGAIGLFVAYKMLGGKKKKRR